MLNVHGKCGRLIQSTTSPRSGPGARNSRSHRLPAAPPSTRPSAMDQPMLRSRRAVRIRKKMTAQAISAMMTV